LHQISGPYGLIKNPAGNFIEPSLSSTQEAASSSPLAKSLPAGDQSWTSVEMLNSPGPNAYPIASFTYLLLYKDMSNTPMWIKQRQNPWLILYHGQLLTDKNSRQS
jgi:phosphate transport system substrate-binding protein